MNLLKKFFYMPEGAAEHADRLDTMIDLVHWLMLILFIVWGTFFVYCLIRFRASKNPTANYKGVTSHKSTYGEIAIAIVEAVLLISFAIPAWAARVDEIPTGDDVVHLRVVAEQFAWNMHYPGKDGKFGRTDIELINLETNPLGIDRDDPDAADDITTINQMHLPVDRPVVIRLSSKDVIHSLGLPHFRSKQDAVPGLNTPMWFVPNTTTAEMREKTGDDEFQYEIICSQLCGLGHYRMQGWVTVHTEDGFQAWIDEETELLAESGGDDFWN